MFLNMQFQSRYWFFIPLFAVYAAIPVVSLVLQAENHRKYLWYAVYVAFALNWVLKPVCGMIGIKFNTYMTMPVAGGFLMYALFGYLVSTEQWCRRKRVILYLSAVVSGVFFVVYTIYQSAVQEADVLYLAAYEYFPSALTGAAIFVFMKHLCDKQTIAEAFLRRKKLTKLIRTVSECCMGVSEGDYLYRFVVPLIVFAACIFGVWVVRKIPVLKHIV